MEKLSWNQKKTFKKYIKKLSSLSLDLKLPTVVKSNLSDALLFSKKICPDLLQEYKVISESSNANTLDLFNYMLVGSLKLTFTKETSFACLPEITKDNRILIGSTSQYHGAEPTIFKIKSNEYNFIGIGETLSDLKCGLNNNGLFISNHKMYSREAGKGLTPGIMMRLILERAGSLNDALRMLDQFPHAGCSSYFLSHRNNVLIFEASPNISCVVHPQKGFLIAANHFIAEKMVNLDEKNIIFPENNSIQRDSHAAYIIMQNRRKIKHDTLINILSNKTGDITSTEGNFTTKYSIIYEQGNSFLEVSDGSPLLKKFKKVKI